METWIVYLMTSIALKPQTQVDCRIRTINWLIFQLYAYHCKYLSMILTIIKGLRITYTLLVKHN